MRQLISICRSVNMVWCKGTPFSHLNQGDPNPCPFPDVKHIYDLGNVKKFIQLWKKNEEFQVSEKLVGLGLTMCTDGHVAGKSKVICQFQLKENHKAKIRGPLIEKNEQDAKNMMLTNKTENLEEVPDMLENLRLMTKSMVQNIDCMPFQVDFLLYGVLIQDNDLAEKYNYYTSKKGIINNYIYCHALGIVPHHVDSELELIRKMPHLKPVSKNGKRYYLWLMDDTLKDWFDKFMIPRIDGFKTKKLHDIVAFGQNELKNERSAGYIFYSLETDDMYKLEPLSAKNKLQLDRHLKIISEAKKSNNFQTYPWLVDEESEMSDFRESLDEEDTDDEEADFLNENVKKRKFKQMKMSLFH